jgi:hypothetical protein
MLLNLAGLPYIPLILFCLLLQDLAINYTRAKLAAGDLRYRTAYLALVFATVCFYTGLAIPLWHAPNVFSRSFATGLLLTIPLMGVLRGYRDRSFLVLTTALPVCTLTALALRDFFMLGDNVLLMSAGIPVVIGGVVLLRAVYGLHAADVKLQRAEMEREHVLRDLEASRARLEQVATLSGVAGWEMNVL